VEDFDAPLTSKSGSTLITPGLKRTAVRIKQPISLVRVVGLVIVIVIVIVIRSNFRVHRAGATPVVKIQHHGGIAYCIGPEGIYSIKMEVLHRQALPAEIKHD
jgi:hypothetical protein